jgi:hypothetical protein
VRPLRRSDAVDLRGSRRLRGDTFELALPPRFAQAIVASPAMFRRVEGGGSLYWLGARDDTGAYLDG